MLSGFSKYDHGCFCLLRFQDFHVWHHNPKRFLYFSMQVFADTSVGVRQKVILFLIVTHMQPFQCKQKLSRHFSYGGELETKCCPSVIRLVIPSRLIRLACMWMRRLHMCWGAVTLTHMMHDWVFTFYSRLHHICLMYVFYGPLVEKHNWIGQEAPVLCVLWDHLFFLTNCDKATCGVHRDMQKQETDHPLLHHF